MRVRWLKYFYQQRQFCKMKSGFVVRCPEKHYKLLKEFAILEHQPDFLPSLMSKLHCVAYIYAVWPVNEVKCLQGYS